LPFTHLAKVEALPVWRCTSEDTIQYDAIIDDPNVYTATWKVAFPLNKDERYRIFEYACHEGNYALGHVLQPARPSPR
jgi:hypothetical protein